jgi:hypothetical protein
MSAPLLNEGPVDQLMLINVLNVMYNENTRQIQQLNEYNTEIRNVITTLLYSRINNDNNNNNMPRSHFPTSSPATHTRNFRTTHTGNNRTTHTGNNRTTQTSNIYPNINTTTNRNRNTYNSNRNNASVSTTNNSQANNANRRIYIDNIPYVIDNIRQYNIPNRAVDAYDNLAAITSPSRPRNLATTFGSFFDPVVIYPNQSQIELATRNVRYCDIVTPINLSCPISLENFNDTDMVTVIRFCGHIFNTDPLNRWFTTNCRCPVCRYDIRNYNSNSSSLVSNIQPRQPDIGSSNFAGSSETTNEERNGGSNTSPLSELFYTFITSDISGNPDATAILSLITSLQLNI